MNRRPQLLIYLALALTGVGLALLLLDAAPRAVSITLLVGGTVAALAGRRYLPVVARDDVTVDGEGVQRQLANGRVEQVRWEDLVLVSLVAMEDPAQGDELFFLLQAEDGSGCVVESEEARRSGLVTRLEQLPRFDRDALHQASRCTVEAHFVCWQGIPGEGLAAAG